jgi:hypothetical protein
VNERREIVPSMTVSSSHGCAWSAMREGDALTVHHVANIRIDEQAAAHDPGAGLG